MNNFFKDKKYKMIFLFFILSILSLLIIINYLEDSDGYLAILGSLITIIIYNVIFIMPVIEPKEKIRQNKENNFDKTKEYIKLNKYYKYIYNILSKYAYIFYILLGITWTIIDLVIHKNNISNMKIVRLIMWNFVCVFYSMLDIIKKINKKR